MKKVFTGVLLAGTLTGAAADSASAQGCIVCTRTAETQGEEVGKSMNKGIIYLAFLPLAIIGGVGYMWWRQRQ